MALQSMLDCMGQYAMISVRFVSIPDNGMENMQSNDSVKGKEGPWRGFFLYSSYSFEHWNISLKAPSPTIEDKMLTDASLSALNVSSIIILVTSYRQCQQDVRNKQLVRTTSSP